ncbi:Probable isoaspartyl peptidase/L-asparaginase 3, partial [Linum perenne]
LSVGDLGALTDKKNRGRQDFFLLAVDIETVFLPRLLRTWTIRRGQQMPTASLSGYLVFLLTLLLVLVDGSVMGNPELYHPLVVSTWPFKEAVRAAWKAVDSGLSAVDSVVEGCSVCEVLRCDGTVGPGGSPDENGETTIDAMIMNGVTMEVGAVGAMRYVTDGIRAAKLVMEYSKHTFLVGEKASVFAISMGLQGPTNLSSSDSIEKWNAWRDNGCQPNFRDNVLPANGCGPYHAKDSIDKQRVECSKPISTEVIQPRSSLVGRHNHDTISMAVIDRLGNIAAGTSTNGATFKIPGRVGDGPITGSAAYTDSEVGACGATGDGDIMMRFLPCYQVVESMRRGMEPKLAAEDAISRIARKFPDFIGAVFAVNKNGVHAGACHGWTFQYSVRNSQMNDVQVFTVLPGN